MPDDSLPLTEESPLLVARFLPLETHNARPFLVATNSVWLQRIRAGRGATGAGWVAGGDCVAKPGACRGAAQSIRPHWGGYQSLNAPLGGGWPGVFEGEDGH
jgi:hypothetical protein